MSELKVTVGELGFALGVVATARRGFDLVKDELGLPDDATQTVLAISGQSLLAHDLATHGDKSIQLVPPLREAAEIIAGTEWAVRCARQIEGRNQSVTIYIAPKGLIAQTVEGDVVLRLTVLPTVAAMLERIASFFELPPAEGALTRVSREDMEALAKLGPTKDLGAALARAGVSEGNALAGDIKQSLWKGTIARVSHAKSQLPESQLAVAIVYGSYTWMLDTRDPDFTLVGRASRKNLGESIKGILRGLDATTLKFDLRGEL